MNIEDVTIGEARNLANMFNQAGSVEPHRWAIGEAYFIQTVTHYWLGIVTHVDEHEIEMKDAAWVADTGRFARCLAEGTIEEMEPCPDGLALIGRGALICAQRWTHPVPRTVIEK